MPLSAVVIDDVEQGFLQQIRMAVLGETVKWNMDKFFEAVRSAEAFGPRLLCNNGFLSLIALFVQTNPMDAISDQRTVDVLRATWNAIHDTTNTTSAAQAYLRHRILY